jgi:hypothetical protein
MLEQELNVQSIKPFLPSVVMPTGAYSLIASQALFEKLLINCAEWRHLTHCMLTQLGQLLSSAIDFSISQRAFREVYFNVVPHFFTALALCSSRSDKRECYV